MTEEQRLSVVQPNSIESIEQHFESMKELVRSKMKEEKDYGIIPGTKNKTLFDPGAEKLAKLFGLRPEYTLVDKVQDFEKGFFYYRYKADIIHIATGKSVGDAERSCNSFEKKYLFRTEWSNGRKSDVRKSVEELIAGMNTYEAMAQKRAFVEGIKTATMASGLFLSDDANNPTPPYRPTTKAQDPARVKLLSKLFVVAADRGFSPEKLKERLYKKYIVSTMDDIANKDITETIESLSKKFDVVGKGNPPKALITFDKPSPAAVEDGEIESDSTDELDAALSKCYWCKKDLIEGKRFNEYYCSQECQNEYIKKNNPKKWKQMQMESFGKKGDK